MIPPLRIDGGSSDMLVEASSLQRSMWLAEQLAPTRHGYAMPLVWRVRTGRIQAHRLRDAVTALIEKHEILRTGFVEHDGQLWQRIGEPWTAQVERADFATLAADQQDAAWQAWVRRVARRPFDLGSGRLLRPGLVDLGPAGQILLLCTHHLVSDGYSMDVLLRDLDALFSDSAMASAGLQYREFVRMQDDWQETEEGRAALAFWVRRLRGAPDHLSFQPPDRAERDGAVRVALGADLPDRLPGLRRQHGVSWFMVLASTLAALVHKWSGLSDVTFGCQVANRTREVFEDVVGPCTNAVVLRSRCDATTTRANLVDAMREQVLGALDHQQVPFEAVVGALRPARQLGHTPYREVVLGTTTLASRVRLGDCELEYLATSLLDAETKFGMAVTVSAAASDPWVVMSYQGERFTATQVQRMAAEFADMLDWITGAPADALLADVV
ncbi:condensation domain-containing protein [Actinocrispum wychmicini]|uniref:Condensation domain-containing protein n=1 Tax=Actinocrispum wychmicini TaxID=1213861 RepID=A0A4R2JVR7_9PSEU|nr:condensation domain-containing protein [Actinocrispum wychmicini]TCO61179.1 condensation domain-containing protein [Actinocrispum wychmicini]